MSDKAEPWSLAYMSPPDKLFHEWMITDQLSLGFVGTSLIVSFIVAFSSLGREHKFGNAMSGARGPIEWVWLWGYFEDVTPVVPCRLFHFVLWGRVCATSLSISLFLVVKPSLMGDQDQTRSAEKHFSVDQFSHIPAIISSPIDNKGKWHSLNLIKYGLISHCCKSCLLYTSDAADE